MISNVVSNCTSLSALVFDVRASIKRGGCWKEPQSIFVHTTEKSCSLAKFCMLFNQMLLPTSVLPTAIRPTGFELNSAWCQLTLVPMERGDARLWCVSWGNGMAQPHAKGQQPEGGTLVSL